MDNGKEDIKAIFWGAVEKADPQDRRDYLDEVCGENEEARTQVEALLKAHEKANGFLKDPVLESETDQHVSPVAEAPGKMIGPYRLLEQIGEGGMATVFMAEQDQPFHRRVALKIVKLGMDTKQVVSRFEAERQALALMDHANIAKIYDAGATDTGRPYFVMELVRGIPITEYCDKNRLSTKERLHLLISVCQATQHAHQKGIIHRDIKPSNVLVSLHEGRPVIKVIDFGIAKAMNQRLTEKTLFTRFAQMVGTPQYMSPEQAEFGGLDVDTRTDIYSLGVLLYELLTGSTPFSGEELLTKGYAEMQKIIAETEPDRPSTKLSVIGDAITDIAERRQTSPGVLTRLLSGDLDWIVMKSLEKDRTRRYDTASELAADIERHLNHEPVLASPPNVTYRLGKFLRKHRGPVTVAAVIMLMFLIGLAGILLMYGRSVRSEENLAEALKERSQALDEILRLSDIKRLRDLEAQAEQLWPCVPDIIPDMEVWLKHARTLARRLTDHQAALAVLRANADSHYASTWSFADTETVWHHEVLTELVNRFQKFCDSERGALPGMERRLQFARTIHRRSLEDHSGEWSRAIASIGNEAECPKYRGLKLTPQLGLVPVGQDPQSGLWEFSHLQTGRVPVRDSNGKLCLTEDTGLIFVLIPGDTFMMGAVEPSEDSPEGSPNVDPEAEGDETPVHEVALDAFFLSKYEMTQGQWLRFTGSEPFMYGPDEGVSGRRHSLLHPVENVDWGDCDLILRRLGFTLPTEAQWEYAARAKTTTVWWTGNDKKSIGGAANLSDRFCRDNGGPSTWQYEEWLDDGYITHAPVGSYVPNGFGLHDTMGNVWEWCRDWYGPYGNGFAPGNGERRVADARSRVYRGGGWRGHTTYARSAARFNATPGYRDGYLGVRAARGIR